MKFSELALFGLLFVLSICIAQLSVRAITIENSANEAVISEHKAYLASNQVKE